jgi:hypothetical protein
MERDFDQIIGDVRYLLSRKKPKITKRNPAQVFGRYRGEFDMQTRPSLFLSVFEVSSLFGGTALYGGVEVILITGEGCGEITQMAWSGDGRINFRSPLIGTDHPVEPENLSGVVLDRLYNQIAIPLHKTVNTPFEL